MLSLFLCPSKNHRLKYLNTTSHLRIIFSGVLLLHFVDLVIFFLKFLTVYTDSDQTILWLAGTDMSRGIFYEPAFYGQSYNSMIEAVLSLPMIWAGVFIPLALNISTVVLSYSAIWLFSWYFYKKGNFQLSILCLALPILLPTEFQLMISISRGFIPGIAFVLYGVYCYLTHKGNFKLALSGFFIAFGVVFNLNCSVILVPFVVYYLLQPSSTKRNELFLAFLGSLPAIFFKAFIVWFYSTFPNYNMHVFPNEFGYSIKNWTYAASEIYYLFKGLFPIVNNLGCLSIILLLVLLLLILKKSNKSHEKLAAVSGFLFILFSFGISKVSDGTGSPFFPYSRMFLAIPALYIFYLAIIKHYTSLRIPYYILLISVLGVFIFKTISLPDRIKYIVEHNTGAVRVDKIENICHSCDSIQRLLTQTKTDLIVLKTKRDEINYGCPALINGLKTIHPTYERRLWVYEKEMFTPRKKFLLYMEGQVKDTSMVMVAKNYYIVTLPSAITLEEWYKSQNFTLRNYNKSAL